MTEPKKPAAKPAAERAVPVTTGTQGPRQAFGPGPDAVDKVVAEKDEHPVLEQPAERDEKQKLPVERDGSVGAKWGHQVEMRRVEDGDGSPRHRVEDGEPPDGFVVHVPPERGLEP